MRFVRPSAARRGQNSPEAVLISPVGRAISPVQSLSLRDVGVFYLRLPGNRAAIPCKETACILGSQLINNRQQAAGRMVRGE